MSGAEKQEPAVEPRVTPDKVAPSQTHPEKAGAGVGAGLPEPGNVPCIPSPERRLSGRSRCSDLISPRKPGTPATTARQRFDYKQVVTRLSSGHTHSSRAKKNAPFLRDSFMDGGGYAWNKMDLFKDYHHCMWTNNGALKTSYRIKS